MVENTNQEIGANNVEIREKNFEGLKNFFKSDMRIKESLLNLAPTQKDDYSEESRIAYVDRAYKQLRDFEMEFNSILKNVGLEEYSGDIKMQFNKIKEKFLVSNYKPGFIQNLYKTEFANMDLGLIEEVKKCKGHFDHKDLGELIKSSSSINELLHTVHSWIVNDDEILTSMPVIDTKRNDSITLYGQETELSRKLFDEIPSDFGGGFTEIVSMEDKILMMVRDKGHALTIDIDTSKENDIFVKYFIPKLCNREMVEALPGINSSSITDNGAIGAFQTSKEEMSQKLLGFIEKVPGDEHEIFEPIYLDDMEFDIKKDIEKEESKNEQIYLFNEQNAKELANGRRMGAIAWIKERLSNAKNRILKFIGKDTDDRTNGD